MVLLNTTFFLWVYGSFYLGRLQMRLGERYGERYRCLCLDEVTDANTEERERLDEISTAIQVQPCFCFLTSTRANIGSFKSFLIIHKKTQKERDLSAPSNSRTFKSDSSRNHQQQKSIEHRDTYQLPPSTTQTLTMSTYGTLFRVTTFGESHCASVGAIIDGCPPVCDIGVVCCVGLNLNLLGLEFF